jgi:hypothetical protein
MKALSSMILIFALLAGPSKAEAQIPMPTGCQAVGLFVGAAIGASLDTGVDPEFVDDPQEAQ